MRNHRHDEFSIHLRWRPKLQRLDDVPPGFYLVAGWANEGEADYPIDNVRLDAAGFRTIMAALDTATGCDGTFAAAGARMIGEAEGAINARKVALRTQIAKAEQALSELEQSA